MARTLSLLAGARGWTTVAGLTAVLSGLVAVQLPAANADAGPAVRRVAVSRVVVPVPPTDPTTTTPLQAARVRTVEVARAVAAAETAAADARARAAASLCSGSGSGWQDRRGQAALGSLRGGAERTGFRVDFAAGRTGHLGLTHLDERRIEVFVRSCDAQPVELLRHVVAHELGHAWDTTRMSTTSRAAWQRARGIPAGTPWYGCSGCTDFATPAGDFAEVYAQWARGATSNRSKLAGDVPADRLQALARQFFGA